MPHSFFVITKWSFVTHYRSPIGFDVVYPISIVGFKMRRYFKPRHHVVKQIEFDGDHMRPVLYCDDSVKHVTIKLQSILVGRMNCRTFGQLAGLMRDFLG